MPSNCLIKGDSNLLNSYEQRAKEIDAVILDLKLPRPALRALVNLNIKTLEEIRKMGLEKLSLCHGMGPKSIELLKTVL